MRPLGSPTRTPSALLAALVLGGVAGCSSPDRGPESDVVEVERIDPAVPTDAGDTPSDASGRPSDADITPAGPAAPPAP